jgi:hypothetical protein
MVSYPYGPLTFNLVPVDLELQDVTLSTNLLWCGDAVTIAWNGRNLSGAPLLGSWVDAVYFSKDDHWDINDVLVGTVVHTGGLQSNELYAASSTFFVPGAFSGDYYLIIRADVYNQEREATGEANNVLATPTPVVMPELTVGTPRADLFLANKHARYYQVVVPDGEDLRVTLDLAATNGATTPTGWTRPTPPAPGVSGNWGTPTTSTAWLVTG